MKKMYFVMAFCGLTILGFSQINNSEEGKTTTYSTATWTGNVDNEWLLDGNWDVGVPDENTDVIIPVGLVNYPLVQWVKSSAPTCHDITLESNSNGSASLFGQVFLNVTGTAYVQKNVSGYTTSEDGWYFLSSPIHNPSISGSDFVSGTFDLYRWGENIEADEKWLNYEGGSFGVTEYLWARGYLFAESLGGTFNFVGDFNGDCCYGAYLTYTAGEGDGWNLIGNPYCSGVDWNTLDKSEGNIDGSFYIVNPDDGTYLVSNGTSGDLSPANEIPICQG
ncbi:MAG: hypothetical protein GQ527_00200 [Bacteroidales bacterium]|nr:hypothetical protein [Bacteroidales bacterium]